jgi:hypothetical protein
MTHPALVPGSVAVVTGGARSLNIAHVLMRFGPWNSHAVIASLFGLE